MAVVSWCLPAVLGALAGAAALFVYGLVDTVVVIVLKIGARRDFHRRCEAIDTHFIEIFDHLLGTVMLIMSRVEAELFLDSDELAPGWKIRTFEDLKSNWSRWSSWSWP